jgi:single-strand DNA-binding protein
MALPKINSLFRLTRDAEAKYSASGTAVVNLGLASSEKYKDKETQCFIDAVAFGKVGEIIAQYAGTKGTQIYLSGKLQTEQWQDKQTGANRYKHVMVIEGFDFVSGQNNGHSQGHQQPQNQPQQGFQGGQNNGHQQASNFQQPNQMKQTPTDFSDDVPF